MLVGLKEILNEAKKNNIAIGSFNTPNLECVLAVLSAAEELNVPVIIMHAQCHENIAPIEKIGRVMVALAKASKVKVCVHLDHGEDLEYCKKAIDLGFSSIMIDNSIKPYEENIALTSEAVCYAHAHGVDVEAELGALPQREGGIGDVAIKKEDLYTRPDLVPKYLLETGIDALALAFGTAHGIYKTKPILNMDIISQVKALTDIPLVMHGGSGISKEDYLEVIKRGIRKINYYSYMSYAGYAKAKEIIEKKDADFYHVLAYSVEQEMKENAKNILKIFANIK